MYNAPGTAGHEDTFDFEFESENGIKQAAEGEMRTIGGEDVMVMRGSYQYIDADGQDVLVTWYADETGYHAESNILPVAPAIPFEEQRLAVEAQIKFAQEQIASGAASNEFETFATSPQIFEENQVIEVRTGNLPGYQATYNH